MEMVIMKTRSLVSSLLPATMLLLAACSESTGPNGSPQVSLSFSTSGASAAAQAVMYGAFADVVTDGQNTLVIDQVEVVLREIELKRIDASCDQAIDEDDCSKFEVGPMLVDLPLNGATSTELTISVEPGLYREVEFDIHKVSNGDPLDAGFREQYPDMLETSIRVRGTFNDEPFVYTTDLDEELEYELTTPLEITAETQSTNVTLDFDISGWFVDEFGGLVNPDTANKGGENESIVNDNIKQSIEAFEDEDRDGEDDHS
jgi:hypothetical protein